MIGALHSRYRRPKEHLLSGRNVAVFRALSNAEKAGNLDVARRLDEYHVRQARKDPSAFVEYCMRDDGDLPLRQAWFHEELHDALDSSSKVAIALPRDSGKSTQMVARVVWELGRNPNLRVKIVAETDQRAKDRLYQISLLIASNAKVRKVFPSLIPDQEGSWTKGRLFVRRTSQQRDPSVEALGVLSSATGGRCDLLIGDDVVGRKTALTQPGYREEVKRAWHADWENVVEPSGRIWYIFTPWHHDDLSAEILTNRLYHKLFIPIEDGFSAIWPERYPESVLRERYALIGPIEYARAFLLKPSDQSEQIVQAEWLRFFDPYAVPAEGLKFFLSYDLASAQTARADYTACVYGALTPDRKRLLIMDAWHDKITFPVLLEKIKRDAKLLRGADVLTESVQYQRVVAQTLQAEEPWLVVHQCHPVTNKAERLRATTPYLVNGAVQFSQVLRSRTPDHPRGDLLHEMLEFGFARNDDMVDAFTQLVGWTATQQFASSAQRHLDFRVLLFTDAPDEEDEPPVTAVKRHNPWF